MSAETEPNAFRQGQQLAPAPVGVKRDASAILRQAADIVGGARNQMHGEKERSFGAIAADWTAYLNTRRDPHGPVRSVDVAHMMVRLKQQRAEHGSLEMDHFLDAAGYSAIAWELARTTWPTR